MLRARRRVRPLARSIRLTVPTRGIGQLPTKKRAGAPHVPDEIARDVESARRFQDDYAKWKTTLQTTEQKFTSVLTPGVWNPVEVVILGTTPEQIRNLEVAIEVGAVLSLGRPSDGDRQGVGSAVRGVDQALQDQGGDFVDPTLHPRRRLAGPVLGAVAVLAECAPGPVRLPT